MKPAHDPSSTSHPAVDEALRCWTSIEMRMETGNLYLRGSLPGPEAVRVRCVLTQRENVIHEERFSAEEFVEGVSFRDIPVRVWWPAGAGEQPLYQLRVELEDAAGQALWVLERRVGFKHVAWEDDSRCVVNGRPFELRGGTWTKVPDGATEAEVRDRLQPLMAAGVNALSVSDEAPPQVYDLCDELGLLVWQALPGDAEEAMVRRAVVRLQPHVSLLVWDGPAGASAAWMDRVVDELDPTRRYAPTAALRLPPG